MPFGSYVWLYLLAVVVFGLVGYAIRPSRKMVVAIAEDRDELKWGDFFGMRLIQTVVGIVLCVVLAQTVHYYYWTKIPAQTMALRSDWSYSAFPQKLLVWNSDKRLVGTRFVSYAERKEEKLFSAVSLRWGGTPEATLAVMRRAAADNMEADSWVRSMYAVKASVLATPTKIWSKTARAEYLEQVCRSFAELPPEVEVNVSFPVATLTPEGQNVRRYVMGADRRFAAVPAPATP